MAARMLRLHHASGKIHVEAMATFAKANETNLAGAKRMLAIWESKKWIARRPDGGYDVKHRVGRRDPETLRQLRNEGLPTPGFIPAPDAEPPLTEILRA